MTQPSEQPRTTEPLTTVGQALLANWNSDDKGQYVRLPARKMRDAILAIEAEAISVGHKEGYLSRAADEEMRAEAAAPDLVASPLDPMTLIEMLYEEVRRLDELSDPDGSLAEALSFRRAGVKFSIGKVKSWAATPSKMAGEGQPVAEEPA